MLEPTIYCPSDIIFVVDVSGSISPNDFDLVKSFLKQLVRRLDIDSNTTLVGLVTYSTTVTTSFYLDTYFSVDLVQTAISQLTHTMGLTHTAAALAHVRTTMLTSARGDRSNATNVVVILTDGRSTNTTATQVCTMLQCCLSKNITKYQSWSRTEITVHCG